MPASIVKPNTIGLTRHIWTELGGAQQSLESQLSDQAIPYEIIAVPHLVGMGGSASVICYVSPHTERPVSVLSVPARIEVDASFEENFYVEGMTQAEALAKGEPWWIEQVWERRADLVHA